MGERARRRWVFWCIISAVGAGINVHAIGFPQRWRWSSPGPHGNNIYDVAYDSSQGLAVQAADSGQLYTSTDLSNWIPRATGTTNALRAVTFWNGRALVTGANGAALYADAPDSFQPGVLSPGSTTDWLEGVATSGSLAVAVGDNFAIYTSANGINWQRQSVAHADWLRGVAYGNGNFVAVGETGTIATSPNGTNWSKQASATVQDLNRVVFTGTRFFAVGNAGSVVTSTYGTNWTSLAIGSTNDLFAVALDSAGIPLIAGDGDVRIYNPTNGTWTTQMSLATNAPPNWPLYGAFGLADYYLLAGRTGMVVQGVRTNTSPYAWTILDDASRNWLWDLTLTNGLYITVGDQATVMTSGTGVNWTLEVVPDSVTNSVFLGVTATSNQLVVVGNQGSLILSTNGLTNISVTNIVGTNVVVTTTTNSTLGVIWTDVVPRPTTNDLQGAATFGDLFVVSGDNGTILTSLDGKTWIKRTTPTTEFLSSLAVFPGGMVAVGSSGTILTSGDGISWGLHSFSTTNWIYRVRYLGGRLIAVGQNGTILTSVNGINWTLAASGTTEWLNDVTLVPDTNQTWFAVGTSGIILASGDTVTWTNQPSITIKSLYSVQFDGNRLVASGIEGIILRSLVVPFTNAVDIVSYSLAPAGGNQLDSLFQFQGLPDQQFTLDRTSALGGANTWNSTGPIEVLNGDGTVYYLETYSTTNLPARQFFRTTLKQ